MVRVFEMVVGYYFAGRRPDYRQGHYHYKYFFLEYLLSGHPQQGRVICKC